MGRRQPLPLVVSLGSLFQTLKLVHIAENLSSHPSIKTRYVQQSRFSCAELQSLRQDRGLDPALFSPPP